VADSPAGPVALPAEIAVFPLPGALLLPQGRLPLNIFEPRYLAMTQDSLAAGRMFGMIQPDPGAPRGPNGPGLYRIGCLGRLTSFAETDDGRMLITLTGMTRFQVAEELDMRRGYRRVRADYGPFLADLDASPPVSAIDRPALLAALRPFFKARGIEANWDAVEQTSDPMLVLTLAMICPFDVPEKQALLEAATPTDRAAMLIALLQMGAHGAAAGDAPPDQRPS
jgi:Lon protease-like protein